MKEFKLTFDIPVNPVDKFLDHWFEQCTLNDFLINQRVNIIVALTVEYHKRCEQYDRTVCRGWSCDAC